jgi:hypothetical protein
MRWGSASRVIGVGEDAGMQVDGANLRQIAAIYDTSVNIASPSPVKCAPMRAGA